MSKRAEYVLEVRVGLQFLKLAVSNEVDFVKYLRKLARRHEARNALEQLPKDERCLMDEGSETELCEEWFADFLLDPPTAVGYMAMIETHIIDSARHGNLPRKEIEREMNRIIIGGR